MAQASKDLQAPLDNPARHSHSATYEFKEPRDEDEIDYFWHGKDQFHEFENMRKKRHWLVDSYTTGGRPTDQRKNLRWPYVSYLPGSADDEDFQPEIIKYSRQMSGDYYQQRPDLPESREKDYRDYQGEAEIHQDNIHNLFYDRPERIPDGRRDTIVVEDREEFRPEVKVWHGRPKIDLRD